MMLHRIDGNSPLPLYHQLIDILKEKIIRGEWPEKTQIPTEHQLMETYGVGRSTVRNAVLELVRIGYCNRRRGKGTFVARPRMEADFIRDFFPSYLGGRHTILKASVVDPRATVRDMLQLPAGARVTELIRLRFVDDQPLALEKSYVSHDLCPELAEARVTGKITDWLRENRGIAIGKVRTYLEAGIINAFESRTLKIKQGAPTLIFTRINYDAQSRPLIVMKSILRGDRIRLVFDSDNGAVSLIDGVTLNKTEEQVTTTTRRDG